MAKSRRERVSLGSIAAFPGTLITPMYLLEFRGEMSRVMSRSGDPLTLSNSSKSSVSSSEDPMEAPSKPWKAGVLGLFKNSEKLPWINSTAAIVVKLGVRAFRFPGSNFGIFSLCMWRKNSPNF